MDSENTKLKSRAIRFYPSSEQKRILKEWIGASRYVYNKTIEYLHQSGTKANWIEIKSWLLKDLPSWTKPIPFQIKAVAVRDACQSVKLAKQRYRETGKPQTVHFKSRKWHKQSFFLTKSAIKEGGFYVTLLGNNIRYKELLPKIEHDARVICENGRWYVCTPVKIEACESENQGRIVSLDPGVRTFLTFYAEEFCGKIGQSDFGRIHRLCYHLDNLISRTSKTSAPRKHRMRQAQARLRSRIRNLIDELHHKSARFLCKNFDVILIPKFETSQMANKTLRQITSKTARSMLNFAHFRFRQFLQHKAFEMGKQVIVTCEAYTSKTLSWSGQMINNLGGRKIVRDGNIIMDRDYNGARGILLRALVDSPTLNNIKSALINGMNNG